MRAIQIELLLRNIIPNCGPMKVWVRLGLIFDQYQHCQLRKFLVSADKEEADKFTVE